jgi:hypothetical protein
MRSTFLILVSHVPKGGKELSIQRLSRFTKLYSG